MSSSLSAYAGDVTPQDAWATLQDEAASALVDVRTVAEWTFVGVPELAGLGKRAGPGQWRAWAVSATGRARTCATSNLLALSGASCPCPASWSSRSRRLA